MPTNSKMKCIIFLMFLIFLGSFASVQGQTKLPLPGGTSLIRGQKYYTQSSSYYLLLGTDGNLTVNTAANKRVWGLDQVFPGFKDIGRIEVQSDGNLIARNASGGFLWSALSQNTISGSQLLVNASGALQLVWRDKVTWSSDGNLNSVEVIPDYGWTYCRILKDPKIVLMGSRTVSKAAMDAVEYIYTDMTSRFKADYPKNKFDGYVIYLTNEEPWSELSKLAPIGTMMVDGAGINQGEELQGGTSPDYLWITEQMICKKGVKSRNEAFAAGRRAQRDDDYRTFDQVIHEFGHAIDFRFGLRGRINQVYQGGWNPVEQFPWNIQYWFGAPGGTLSASEKAFIGEIFASATTYSRDLYPMSCPKSQNGANITFLSKSDKIIKLNVYWNEGAGFSKNNLKITNGIVKVAPALGGINQTTRVKSGIYEIEQTDLSKPVIIEWGGEFCGNGFLSIQ